MAYIKVIHPEEAEGELHNIYQNLIKKRGKLAEVHKIQSLNPKSIVNHMDLYITIMFGKSPLKRYQREMIAVVVSSANQCSYCLRHHGDALNHFWKDPSRVDALSYDYTTTGLNAIDIAICEYAKKLTLNASGLNEDDKMAALKNHSLEDRAILDIALITSYFNFVNRMVLGLGVELEDGGGEGYSYD